MSGGDLFGAPETLAERSQWFTPGWIARRMAEWIPPGARVLEPSAGSGALVRALLDRDCEVVAIEQDPAWCAHLEAEFSGDRATVHCGDFLQWRSSEPIRWALMNPPYENDQDAAHVLHALSLGCVVVALMKGDFEFGRRRGKVLWRDYVPQRRALLEARPQFSGKGSASRNYVVLQIVPRFGSPDEAYPVIEERWFLARGVG